MSFFGKIKQNLGHGGVKIEFTAPDHLDKGQYVIPVQVVLSSTEIRQINSITVKIERRYDNSGNSRRDPSVLGSQDYTQPFTLNPGQPLSLNFTVSIAPLDESGTDHPIQRALGGTLEKINNAYDKNSMTNYWHYVTVSADAEDIVLDPQADQRIHIDGMEKSLLRIST
jgi:hypothetical protein